MGGCINMLINFTVATRLTLCSPHLNCSLVLHAQRFCHMLYSFLSVIPRPLHFMCRRFGTLCSIFIVRVNTIFLLGESPASCSHDIWRCHIYRVSQEERTKLRESVPYVKLYRYNPKYLYPKLNGYGDNGQRKVWTSYISAYCTSTAVSH